MRHLSTAAPLLAALILAACSAEGGAPGEGTDTVVVGDVAGEDAAAPPSDVPPPAVRNDGAMSEPEAAAIIPGEWNADLSACGTGLSDTRLRIDAARLTFYESIGMVRRVEIESEQVVDVTAEYRGEGETWTDERRLSLSPDGDSLTITGSTLTRSRCP